MQKAVREINANPNLTQEEKSRRIQELFSSQSQQVLKEKVDLAPCKHYNRFCDIETPCCSKWYGCRLCHDENEPSHILDRTTTKLMRCRECHVIQPVSERCQTPDCKWKSTKYYCERCRLWEDDPTKKIFHCDDCGICRIGTRERTWHCSNCGLCLPIDYPSSEHKCLKDASKETCVCGEYMHTSTRSICVLPCGHNMHVDCKRTMIETGSNSCPKCRKSIFRDAIYERFLRRDIRFNPMPAEFKRICKIACNDCGKRSITNLHWLGIACASCHSFNTGILHTYTPGETLSEADMALETESRSMPPPNDGEDTLEELEGSDAGDENDEAEMESSDKDDPDDDVDDLDLD